MLMADDSSKLWTLNELSASDNAWDDLSIDLGTFLDILAEPSDSSQLRPDASSLNNVPQGEPASDMGDKEHSLLEIGLPILEGTCSFREELSGSGTFSHSYNSEASDSRTGVSDSSFESAGNSVAVDYSKLEPSMRIGSQVHSCSASLTDWMPVTGHNFLCADRDGVSQDALSYRQDDNKLTKYEILHSSSTSNFTVGDTNHVSGDTKALNLEHLKSESEFQFSCLEGDTHCAYLSCNQLIEKSNVSCGTYFDLSENNLDPFESPKTEESFMMDEDIPDSCCQYSAMLHSMTSEGLFYSCPSTNLFLESSYFQSSSDVCEKNSVSVEDEVMINGKDEGRELATQNSCLDSAMVFGARVGRAGGAVLEDLMISHSNVGGCHLYCKGGSHFSAMDGYSFDQINSRLTLDKMSVQPPHFTVSDVSSRKPAVHVKDEAMDEQIASQDAVCQSCEVVDDVVGRKSFSVADQLFTEKGSRQSVSGNLTSTSTKNCVVNGKDEKELTFLEAKTVCTSLDFIGETASRYPTANNHCLDVQASARPCVLPSTSVTEQSILTGEERDNKLIQPKSIASNLSNSSHQAIHNNPLAHRYHVVDDSDISILEDTSDPACQNPSSVNGKSVITSQCSISGVPLNHLVEDVRFKSRNERSIFRVALQDLSQPKSEATPPDGLLAVPLLRHQRIALAWMVQKETTSLHCSGGILADDQGLGKTISTIALILKERPLYSRAFNSCMKPNVCETLVLDEDDYGVSEFDGLKPDAKSCQVELNGSSIEGGNTFVKSRGRPAAGTLVVCPTSVLRQWSEELHNKVTSEANISVLVYHGSNRTKDPLEVAKYDVVLTTYSIVSMEVPKQPLVDEDDDETRESDWAPLASRKRKYPPSSNKRSLKGKKGTDSDLLESVARPLARVGWFRVVLDEAQSIKNHRTQVARACWGLRAKRRWCLSGTPLQNVVDDLYSYFRFLRYDPYAVYKSFCSTIKGPIQKYPKHGYRKLQAILKTVMLRRTKGTLIDGEPIITLPPKIVELKKLDFTEEERDFYCRLEADSRAQFAEYAAAGTVKQNYVNILLMLLRLRQACDHPSLVRGCDSNSVWRSSVEMAKKLPWEKRVSLLNCLEASLAICGICNDPPEDAVCTSCGHVFCNQCICEHLTGDDNQCPFSNCKSHLSVSSVFSRATLSSSLADQPAQESIPDSFDSVPVESLGPCSPGGSFDSSKIKAALEVLQSLSMPRDCASTSSALKSINEMAECAENSYDPLADAMERDVRDNKSLDLNRGPKQLVSVMGEKAIVFSQWTGMLDLLEACLKNSNIQNRRLDGTMSVLAREKAVKDFNTLPEVSVMLMSLKAASLGLNMVAACHVLLLDLWWNPTTEDQAIDRAHRIGQTRPVTVLRLTVKDTVEDRILELQQKKRVMVASAFGEDEVGGRQTRLTVDDLKYLFMV